MIYLIIFLVLWYLIGVAGFIYIWVQEYDFTSSELLDVLLTAIMGPLLFLIYWYFKRQQFLPPKKKKKPKVLIKRKK
jgi:hypothetical protein